MKKLNLKSKKISVAFVERPSKNGVSFNQNQFVLISQKAFSQLTFKCYSEVNPFVKYRDSFIKRKDFADEELRKLKVKYRKQDKTVSEYM